MKSLALLSAPLAPLALIGGWTLAAAQRPGFDSVADTISELAAVDAPNRWIMTTGLALTGLAHVGTAWSLDEAAPWGRVTLGVGGVSAGLVAVFALPSPVHAPVATASFVLLAVWPAAAALPSRRVGWVAAGTLSALLVWFGLELGGSRIGLSERVVAGAQSLWPLAVVAVTAARARRPR
ncbi:DUF998 domain-containing protein [Dermatophilaceae bacterium Soc4.6]